MVWILRIKNNPATIAFIDLKEGGGCSGLGDDRPVILCAATEYISIARRHIEIVKHRDRKVIAAILPMRTVVLAAVDAAVVAAVDQTRDGRRHQQRVVIGMSIAGLTTVEFPLGHPVPAIAGIPGAVQIDTPANNKVRVGGIDDDCVAI